MMLRLAGLLALPEVSAEAEAVLLQATLQMIRCGVVITPEFYAGLTEVERAALLAANQIVEVERSVRSGLATFGFLGIAEVVAPLDGGELRERVAQVEQDVYARSALEAQVAGAARAWKRGTGMRAAPPATVTP